MSCANCKCDKCVYNCELTIFYFTPGEVEDVEDICYCCDECKFYDADYKKQSKQVKECDRFRYPQKYIENLKLCEERKAQRKRKTLKIMEGGRTYEP